MKVYYILNGFGPKTAESWAEKFTSNPLKWTPELLFVASNEPQGGLALKFTASLNIKSLLEKQPDEPIYIRITPENFEDIKNQIQNLTDEQKQQLKEKLHLLTVCNCNFNNRSSSYQENSPEIRKSAEQATKYTNEILKMLGQKPKDTEVGVFGFSTGALLAWYCQKYFSETYGKTILIVACLAPWSLHFSREEKAKILGINGQPVRGADGNPTACPIAFNLTEAEKKDKGLDGYNPFLIHMFLLGIIDSRQYDGKFTLEELFDNLAQLPTGDFILSLHMHGDKVAGFIDGNSITALNLTPDPLQCCDTIVLNQPIEFPGPIKTDDFPEKIAEMVTEFLRNHKELPSPILVCAKSVSATGEEVSRVP